MKKWLLWLLCVLAAQTAVSQIYSAVISYPVLVQDDIERLSHLDPEADRDVYQLVLNDIRNSYAALQPEYPTAIPTATMRQLDSIEREWALLQAIWLPLDRATLDSLLTAIPLINNPIAKWEAIASAYTPYNRYVSNPSHERGTTHGAKLELLRARADADFVAWIDTLSNKADYGTLGFDPVFESLAYTMFVGQPPHLRYTHDHDEDNPYRYNDTTWLTVQLESIRRDLNNFVEGNVGRKGRLTSGANPYSLARWVWTTREKWPELARRARGTYYGCFAKELLFNQYFEFQYACVFWSAIAKLLPQIPELAAEVTYLQSLQTKLGDLHTWMARAEINHHAHLETVFLPQATRKDKRLEEVFREQFTQAMNKKSPAFKPTDIVQIRLMDQDWVEVYSPPSPRIKWIEGELRTVSISPQTDARLILRKQSALIVVHGQDGRCRIHDFSIGQDLVDRKWGEIYGSNLNLPGKEILCDRVQ